MRGVRIGPYIRTIVSKVGALIAVTSAVLLMSFHTASAEPIISPTVDRSVGSLTVTVVDDTGAPVPGVRVHITRISQLTLEGDQPVGSVDIPTSQRTDAGTGLETDGAGTLTAADLPLGTYGVVLWSIAEYEAAGLTAPLGQRDAQALLVDIPEEVQGVAGGGVTGYRFDVATSVEATPSPVELEVDVRYVDPATGTVHAATGASFTLFEGIASADGGLDYGAPVDTDGNGRPDTFLSLGDALGSDRAGFSVTGLSPGTTYLLRQEDVGRPDAFITADRSKLGFTTPAEGGATELTLYNDTIESFIEIGGARSEHLITPVAQGQTFSYVYLARIPPYIPVGGLDASIVFDDEVPAITKVTASTSGVPEPIEFTTETTVDTATGERSIVLDLSDLAPEAGRMIRIDVEASYSRPLTSSSSQELRLDYSPEADDRTLRASSYLTVMVREGGAPVSTELTTTAAPDFIDRLVSAIRPLTRGESGVLIFIALLGALGLSLFILGLKMRRRC